MLKTTIEIDGKPVVFKASAAIPRIYRIKFRRDIYKDLRLLEKSVSENDEDDSHLGLFSLELFENIAYIMAKHADPSIPDTPEEWLDEFNTFSIYQILPQLIELWGLNTEVEIEREMTTPLFLLRCLQIGLSLDELDLLTIGMVTEIAIERANDDCDYPILADQSAYDSF